MATIYCSQKLSTLLGLPRKSKELTTATVDPHSWNAQLFYLNKRKCLLFMHKQTLYAFLVLNIVKKDLGDFPKFFRQHFTDQLFADQLSNSQTTTFLDTAYEFITFFPTDNDKRIIGSINDCIFRIRIYDSRREGTQSLSPTYVGYQLNKTPMGAIDYADPYEKMKKFLEKKLKK
jgi:hypothetical protein